MQDRYFGPYRIIRIDVSRIPVKCSPSLGGDLLCALKQLRHYHSCDNLSSDKEVVKNDLQNAASPEEVEQLEEMTAEETTVDTYYVVAGIVRHTYEQGTNLLTLCEGYGVSEATWQPM